MSEEIGSIHYKLDLNKSAFDKKLSRVGSSVKSAGKTLAVGLGAIGVAATAFGVASVKAFSEAQEVMSQTNAVLKSTKGVAGVTARQVSALASKLQAVTKYGDETIQTGENLLLTFTNIGKDIFPQATETMLDMSQALGQDVKSSAIQLGKALQDPILGVTALRRVGVNFNKEQVNVIKNLVETGKSAEAQRLILKELRTEFGGSARAAGKTLAGQLQILKNTFSDFMEVIGAGLAQRISPVIERFQEWLEKIGGVEGAVDMLQKKWQEILPHLLEAKNKLVELGSAVWDYLQPKVQALYNTISRDLIPAFKIFWEQTLKPLLPILGTTLVFVLGLVISAINVLAKAVAWVARNFNNLFPILATFGSMMLGWQVLGAIDKVKVAIIMQGGLKAALVNLAGYIKSAAFLSPWGIFLAVAIGVLVKVAMEAKRTLQILDETQARVDAAQSSIDAGLRTAAQQYRDGKITKEQYNRLLLSANARAKGGPVSANVPYLVGEKGPELFVPSGNGQIIPNNQVNSSMSIYGNVNIGNKQTADYFFKKANRQSDLLGMGLSPIGGM